MNRTEIFNKIAEIRNILDIDLNGFQSFDVMSKIPLNEPFLIGSTHNEKLIQSDDFIRFFCKMPVGEYFKIHWHDCVEKIHILSGVMKDEKIENMMWSSGDTKIYQPMIEHIPYNAGEVPLFLIIDFSK